MRGRAMITSIWLTLFSSVAYFESGTVGDHMGKFGGKAVTDSGNKESSSVITKGWCMKGQAVVGQGWAICYHGALR
jgi:hypothetical protein